MKYLKLIGINLLILLILLVILEVVFRVLGLGYGNAPLVNDPVLHHVHPVNYEYLMHVPSKEYGGHTIVFDEHGNRIGPEATKPGKAAGDIWLFGDSFTEAMQLPWDSTFAGILQTQFVDYNVVNFGMSSYSPVLHYLKIKRELTSRNKPATVIVQLYSNDVRDDDMYLAKAKFDSKGELVAVDGGTPDKKLDLLRKSYLIRYIRMLQLKMNYVKANKNNAANNGKSINGLLEEALEIRGTNTETYIKKIAALLDSKGIKYFFFVTPSKYINVTKDQSFESFSRKMNLCFEANGIKHVDIDSAFNNSSDTLFYLSDIHFNGPGNLLLANLLQNRLISDGF